MRTWQDDDDYLASAKSNNLTALRLAAALCVVASHCALLRTGHETAEPLAGVTTFNLGDHALNVFFFISGLTIAASLARARGVADFIVARVLRLWPGLLVVTAVTVLVAAPLTSASLLGTYFRDPAWVAMMAKAVALSGATAGLPGLFDANPLPRIVNGSPWTLRYEVLCYALLLVGSIGSRMVASFLRPLWLPASTAAVAVIMVVWPAGDTATSLDHLARFWLAFGLGATLHQYKSPVFRSPASLAAVFAVTAALFAVSIGGRFECVAAIVFVGASTIVLARCPLGRLRDMTNRTDLSYGVYITAWPITQILVAKAPALSQPLLIALVSAFALVAAFLSWTFVEKPALALRRRIVVRLEESLAEVRERSGMSRHMAETLEKRRLDPSGA